MKLIKNLKLKIKNWKRLLSVLLVFLVALFAFFRLTASPTQAGWYDDSWAYRQKVTFAHKADIASNRL